MPTFFVTDTLVVVKYRMMTIPEPPEPPVPAEPPPPPPEPVFGAPFPPL